MSNYSSTSFGDLMVYGLFALVSFFSGAIVVVVFVVATAPLVSIFPTDSGASEIILGVAILWGVVIGCVVAVFTLGPWHRHRARGRLGGFEEADEMPRAAGRSRRRYAQPVAARRGMGGYAATQDGDELDEDGLLVLSHETAPRARRSRYAAEY